MGLTRSGRSSLVPRCALLQQDVYNLSISRIYSMFQRGHFVGIFAEQVEQTHVPRPEISRRRRTDRGFIILIPLLAGLLLTGGRPGISGSLLRGTSLKGSNGSLLFSELLF